MKIRRLEISGFKSFADRVVFSFDDGVTGVVGPNGCGKSNVVDAIRWAMGEQSAKHLRGRSMEDVIFSGSETRPPTGMAEVSLTFQNDGRLVPPQYAGFSEITVTRRLFRNGDSEYEINKTPCRLLDITELFLGTGVGTRAYSIIEQGRIGLIVSAKPEDRRAIIEEAAGVTKTKARRSQAERKLGPTEENLLRLPAVVGEGGKRLQSLERAAKKPEKSRELRGELRELELLAACRQYVGLRETESAQAKELDEAGEAEKVALAHAARLEASLSAERLQLLEDEKKVQQLAEHSHRIDKQLRLSEQEMEFAKRERETIAGRQAQHEEEVSLLGVRLAHLGREEEELRLEQQKLADASAEDEAKQRQAEESLQSGLQEIHDAQHAVEGERHQAVSVLTKLANHRTNLVNLERRRTELSARLQKTVSEKEQLEARGQEIARQGDELAQKLAATEVKRRELHQHKVAAEAELTAGRAEQRETEALFIKLREELADRRSRLTSLLELQKNFEGYGRGVKAIMLREEEERRRDGVYGLVADVLRVEPRYERAIEAVLGERLQLVLVERHAAGLLHKRREVQELAETVQDLEGRLHLATDRLQQLSARLQATDTQVKRLVHEEREEELSQLRLERDVARLQEDLTRIAQRDQVLHHETEQLESAMSEVAREEQTARDAVAAGEGEQSEREARLRAMQGALLRARERAESVQAEVTKAKVSAAALAERREGLARSVQRMQEQRSEVESRRERLQAEIAQGKERDAALQAKAEVCQQELRQLLAESERLRQELGRARAQYDQAQERLRGGDEQVRQGPGEARPTGEARGKAELAGEGNPVERTHLEQQVRERHLMELAEVAVARREAALQLEVSRAEEQMHSLREKIDALGEVSLTAIDEAREVGERFAFLSSQKADLEESIAKLRSAIARIDRASKERFRETFQLINDRFQQVLPRLFRGGTAELQLVEDLANPSAEPGVEIVAQPPGKKLASVNLLSGGEKALTAVSLIFAIFLIKPTPFCLLDEVDAPLDEANVGRYNEMVREMSRSSQFIVITHNKRTMEVADSLYGVTMEEPGISKTVSVKLSHQGATAAA